MCKSKNYHEVLLCPSFASILHAEMMKSKHAAPLRMSVLIALPCVLWVIIVAFLMPQMGLTYMPWNYWYVLFLPAVLVLIASAVARLDVIQGNRALLSSGCSLRQMWSAKVVWCLILSLCSNAIVCVGYMISAIISSEPTVPLPLMVATLACLCITSSWIIPASLFLTTRYGMIAGIAIPFVFQLVSTIMWKSVSFWAAVPSIATVVLPTAFLPVLPSGEPVSSGVEFAASVGNSSQIALALLVGISFTAALTFAGAQWFCRSEEVGR